MYQIRIVIRYLEHRYLVYYQFTWGATGGATAPATERLAHRMYYKDRHIVKDGTQINIFGSRRGWGWQRVAAWFARAAVRYNLRASLRTCAQAVVVRPHIAAFVASPPPHATTS